MSWSTCRAPQTSVLRMKNRALLARRTGEILTSHMCVWMLHGREEDVWWWFFVMTHISDRHTQLTNRKWPILSVCSSWMLTLVKCCPARWQRFVCRLADNKQWPLRALCLWLVWASVSEKAAATGVLLSETMTNAIILRTECSQADINWRGPHKWGNS